MTAKARSRHDGANIAIEADARLIAGATLATTALSGALSVAVATGLLTDDGTTAGLPAAGAPKFATRYPTMGLMSSGFKDAPFSIIWRSVLRQPSSESFSAVIRSRLWQEEQALTTTSLPFPSGSKVSARSAVPAMSTKMKMAQYFIALVAYNIQALAEPSASKNSPLSVCGNARRIHGFLSRVRPSCDHRSREIARRVERRSAEMSRVGLRSARANAPLRNADWKRAD